MQIFKTGDMQRQTKQILDAAKDDGTVEIVRGKERFVLTYAGPAEGDEARSEPQAKRKTATVSSVDNTDRCKTGLLEEMLQVQREILAELRRTGTAGIQGMLSFPDQDRPQAEQAELIREYLEEAGAEEKTLIVQDKPGIVPVPREPEQAPPLDQVTPEQVEAAFGTEPEAEIPSWVAQKATQTESMAAREARLKLETGVKQDSDGSWVLTIAAKEAPRMYFDMLLAEASDTEERAVLLNLGPDAPEVLELIRLRGEALRRAMGE